MNLEKTKLNKNLIFSLLDKIEKVSDRLPNPFMLFLLLSLIVAIFSTIFSFLEIGVIHPVSKSYIEVKSIFSTDGWMLVVANVARWLS